jgi:hypothetical protein
MTPRTDPLTAGRKTSGCGNLAPTASFTGRFAFQADGLEEIVQRAEQRHSSDGRIRACGQLGWRCGGEGAILTAFAGRCLELPRLAHHTHDLPRKVDELRTHSFRNRDTGAQFPALRPELLGHRLVNDPNFQDPFFKVELPKNRRAKQPSRFATLADTLAMIKVLNHNN